ncbi:hypothetical protein C6P40_001921 [Pichia californica]|uniref:Uncharacterized protein n=1 Tax=Pichia californica TaxID=460514 RepID=A0A9P7BD75_9ASCO|nr:hypothetical protein C6P42_002185 [[Candida] californica]KAG0687752.1 hypothetical protein C6P40_001921 [[Candida] californica]
MSNLKSNSEEMIRKHDTCLSREAAANDVLLNSSGVDQNTTYLTALPSMESNLEGNNEDEDVSKFTITWCRIALSGYSPASNGVAERLNLTIMNDVRSMLIDYGFQESSTDTLPSDDNLPTRKSDLIQDSHFLIASNDVDLSQPLPKRTKRTAAVASLDTTVPGSTTPSSSSPSSSKPISVQVQKKLKL